MSARASLFTIAGLVLFATSLSAQKTTAIPVEAEILGRINSHGAKPGAKVFARVAVEWNGPGCTLPEGSTLEGVILAAVPHSSSARDGQLAIGFRRAQCNAGGRTGLEPYVFVIVAVASPPDTDQGSILTDLPSVFGSTAGPDVRFASGSMITNMVSPLLQNIHRFPFTPKLKAGDVVGIKGLKLTVAKGPEGSSIISHDAHDVNLDDRTRVLLLPATALSPAAHPEEETPPAQFVRTAANVPTGTPRPAGKGPSAAAPPALNITPVDTEADLDAGACADGASCDPGSAELAVAISAPAGSKLPLLSLGYSPRLTSDLFEPDNEEAIAWLGPHELLFVFNPHLLIPRHGNMEPGSTVRMMRAALIDTSTRAVKRTMEWRLSDDGQFLWILPGHRLLLHIGNELRLLSEGMETEARLPLDGPLAFGRVSPDGKVIAVGVVKEHHSAELHRSLVESLGHDPQEDVQVLVLNDKLQVVAAGASVTDRMPPILLNEGQIKLLAFPVKSEDPNREYRLQLRTWTDATRNLARFTSACLPHVSSFSPDQLFLVTCDGMHDRRYRILTSEGRILLNSHSVPKQVGQTVIADPQTGIFAIRLFNLPEAVQPGEAFQAAGFEDEQLELYRLGGRRILDLKVSAPSPALLGFAIAPGGSQLAVLTRDGVEFHDLPPN